MVGVLMARPSITARSGELFFLQLKRVLDWLEANGGGGGAGSTFETVSKNLAGAAGTPAYTGKKITSISYANGILKTIAYGGNNLPSTVTLSGATPGGINLVKTLAYSGKSVTSWAYS
jgi:hypothetical protein